MDETLRLRTVITTEQLEQARRASEQAEGRWAEITRRYAGRTGAVPPHDEATISGFRRWVSHAAGQVREAEASQRKIARQQRLLRLVTRIQRAIEAIHRQSQLQAQHWWVAGLICGVCLLFLFGTVCVLLKLPAAVLLVAATVGFPISTGAFVVLTRPSVIQATATRLARLDAASRDATAQARHAEERLTEYSRQLATCLELSAAYWAVQTARTHLHDLESILKDRRRTLLLSDWRSLRGIPFESFLAEVFRTLGYHVVTTKVSGDDGVDFVLSGAGRRIAVQAKGYEGRVGKDPVQEVYTGKKVYGCEECVAITNSSFTDGTRRLAATVGCILIDGGAIPDLIVGRVGIFPDLAERDPLPFAEPLLTPG